MSWVRRCAAGEFFVSRIATIPLILVTSLVSCDSTVEWSDWRSTFVVSDGGVIMTMDRTGRIVHRFAARGHVPRWSSTGSSFVFDSAGGLARFDVGATKPVLYQNEAGNGVRAGSPTLLDDGSIVAQVCPLCELLLIESIVRYFPEDRTTKLLTGPEASDGSPVVAPQGGRIYFLSDRDTTLAGAQIYHMDIDGSDVRRLPMLRRSSGGGLAISRDGGYLAYPDSGQIVVIVDLDRESIADSIRLPLRHFPTGSLSFSPNADSLAVATVDLDRDFGHLVLFDLATKASASVYTSEVGNHLESDWSPK